MKPQSHLNSIRLVDVTLLYCAIYNIDTALQLLTTKGTEVSHEKHHHYTF